MADNTVLPVGAGGDTIADEDIAGVKYQRVKLVDPTVGSTTGIGTVANPLNVANASLPLPTGASTSALQTTGNTSLSSIDTKTPALGQQLAAASSPVVLTAAQLTTLTPPAAITGFALEAGHLATIDTSTAKIPAQGQALAAASMPVVLTAAQITTLTPPAAITGFALEAGHLATIDTSTARIPAQGQALAAASMPVVLTAAQITTLTPLSTVTSNQGTANATPWNENIAQVGGSAVTLGQKVSASSIPVVLASDGLGTTQATAIYQQRRVLNTYTAVFRLAARPYAISKTFTAGSRFQFATIHHAATAVKTVKLKRVEVALESSSVAGITMADLVRITAAPATGNPAITPSPTNPANAAAEATCLTLPTTAGTEGALHSTLEWNLGITGAASVVSPPPALNWYTLWPQTQGASEADENQFPTIRSGVLEGFAVTLDCNAASVVKGYVVIEFTEE